MMAKANSGGKDSVLRERAMIQMEDEVKMEEMESSLRRMVLDLVKPTVQRTTHLQMKHEELREKVKQQSDTLDIMAQEMERTKERAEKVDEFRMELEDFNRHLHKSDTDIYRLDKEMTARLTSLEQRNDSQASWNESTSIALDRAREDIAGTDNEMKSLARTMENGMFNQKELINSEISAVKLSLADLNEDLQMRCDEIWGPKEVPDIAPPSLRRFDGQIRRLASNLADALRDLNELRRLDDDVRKLSGDQGALNSQFIENASFVDQLCQRTVQIADVCKEEHIKAGTRFNTFSTDFLGLSRRTFESEQRNLSELRGQLQVHMSEGQHLISGLSESIHSIGKQVESNMRELHTDMEVLESKRRKEKIATQDNANALQNRLETANDVSGTIQRGVEHICSVLNMSLQSQRMSVALDVQDFVEKKDTPYVGHRAASPKKSGKADQWRKEGIDPTTLTRLVYRPQPITFNGTPFDRADALALREKLVQVAQEALLQGPTKAGKKQHSDRKPPESVPPLVTQVLGAAAAAAAGGGVPTDSPTARGRVHAPRPGSRNQPSARGSPTPFEGEARHASEGGRATTDKGREELARPQDSSAPGRPSGTTDSSTIHGSRPSGLPESAAEGRLPALAGDADRDRPARGAHAQGSSMPPALTAR